MREWNVTVGYRHLETGTIIVLHEWLDDSIVKLLNLEFIGATGKNF